ncbi:MAG: heavy-metal-associated domain-containing protein [Bacilli bacterium]|nr:heavy-metal-associated domain-containing protein [Bacilli bacterium]
MYKYSLEIHGMKCGMCESHINDCIRRNFNVKKVTSNRFRNLTTITSKNELDQEEIKKVIDNTGYILKKIDVEEVENKSFFARLFKK